MRSRGKPTAADLSYDVEVARRELGTLTFGKVTRVVTDDVNLVNRSKSGDERMFSHFYGYALLQDGTSAWFKKASFRPIFVGGAVHAPKLGILSEYPKVGDTIVGKTTLTEKGTAFRFWCHKAGPILEFKKALEAGPSSMVSSSKSFEKMKMPCSRNEGEDDLWALARLLLLKDVDLFVKEYMPEEKRSVHPHSQNLGIRISRNVAEFVFFAAFFARNAQILRDFYDALGGRLPPEADKYNMDCLEHLLSNAFDLA